MLLDKIRFLFVLYSVCGRHMFGEGKSIVIGIRSFCVTHGQLGKAKWLRTGSETVGLCLFKAL